MPFFPESFDVTADVIGVLHLASIETDDETVRFVVGTDGRFVDINGFSWYGSSLFSVGELEVAINGIAPSGEASLSYFQDPAMPELIDDIKLQGADAVDGRPIRFYVQPLLAAEDLQARPARRHPRGARECSEDERRRAPEGLPQEEGERDGSAD